MEVQQGSRKDIVLIEVAGAVFMDRVARILPAKRHELSVITGDYEHMRYGRDTSEERVKRYFRAVRRFKLKG